MLRTNVWIGFLLQIMSNLKKKWFWVSPTLHIKSELNLVNEIFKKMKTLSSMRIQTNLQFLSFNSAN